MLKRFECELAWQPNLHNECEIRTKDRKFEVAVGKEDKKRKIFLHFYAS